ncbi:hypothetical protein F4818DRAFT_130584 [Hypoxylon cercidicola]|nr:hypothetical protein F4818DRAFT_130584 [Hypoxylon cercidicola]
MGSNEFNDAKGWWHTFLNDMGNYKLGFRHQVMLYYPASLEHPPGPIFFAEDGMGRKHTDKNQRFDYTINPSTGEFERLCIQARDSYRRLENSTWDRTIIRNAAPLSLRVSRFPYRGIPLHKIHRNEKWDGTDWLFVSLRWFLAGLALGLGIPDFIVRHTP